MWTRTLLVSLLCAAGCGGGQKGSDTCRAIGRNVGTIYRDRYSGTPAQVAEISGLITERCDVDAWSDAAKKCMLELSPTTSVDTCASSWTKLQIDRLESTVKGFEARVRASAGSGS